MADGDRAAVDVQPVVRECRACRGSRSPARRTPRSAPTGRCRRSSCRCAASSFAHGEDRADAHLVGLAAGHREAAEDAERLQARASPPRLSLITTHAAAPSENWLALPAAIAPPGSAGLIFATPSYVVSARMPSSAAIVTSFVQMRDRSPCRRRPSSPSSARSRRRTCPPPRPPRRAAGSARRTRPALARDVVALRDGLGGLAASASRSRACARRATVSRSMCWFSSFCTQEIDSTPPATKTSPSPAMMRCAASAMVCRPDEQKRLTVMPGTRDRTAGAQRDLARDVAAGRAFGDGAAHDHVVDLGRRRASRARSRAATTWPPIVAPCVMLNAPRQLLASPVRAVDTMTASVMADLIRLRASGSSVERLAFGREPREQRRRLPERRIGARRRRERAASRRTTLYRPSMSA